MKITTKKILIWDKHGLRLNHPQLRGVLGRLDKLIFNYGYPKNKYGLPCFLTIPKLRNQLVIDGYPVFRGGGVNCWNKPIKITPVTINKQELKNCLEVSNKGVFKIRNYEYNGFMGRLLEGYSKLTPKLNELILTNDPGIFKYKDYYIPSFAIEGIQILYKPKQDKIIPQLFGNSSKT